MNIEMSMEKTSQERWDAARAFIMQKLEGTNGEEVTWESPCGKWYARYKYGMELHKVCIKLVQNPNHANIVNDWNLLVGVANNDEHAYVACLYALLGLEARDAVEAERAKEQRLLQEIDRLRSGLTDILAHVANNHVEDEAMYYDIDRLLDPNDRGEPEHWPDSFGYISVSDHTKEIEEERAKSAALEEALEAIIYQDEVNGKGWENDPNSTYSRLCRALEAHKKGGAEQ